VELPLSSLCSKPQRFQKETLKAQTPPQERRSTSASKKMEREGEEKKKKIDHKMD